MKGAQKSKKCAPFLQKDLEVSKFFVPLQSQTKHAEIAQLVEHNLAKVRVASSSLVFRSKKSAEMLT